MTKLGRKGDCTFSIYHFQVLFTCYRQSLVLPPLLLSRVSSFCQFSIYTLNTVEYLPILEEPLVGQKYFMPVKMCYHWHFS